MSLAIRRAPLPAYDGQQQCLGGDDDTWFPLSSHSLPAAAVAACGRCDWARACLAYALTNDVDGIWAGTNRQQRGQLRHKHGLITPAPVRVPLPDADPGPPEHDDPAPQETP